MNKTAKQLAAAGRGGDSLLGHLTPGEVVVPRSVAPLALGLLSDAGIDVSRYQVGRGGNSRNPRTGLLEFFEEAGDNETGRGGERSYGGGNTTDGRGNRAGQDRSREGNGGHDADLDAGRAMMDQNRSELGWSRTDGETQAGTLNNMRDRMREGGYKGTKISDTMRDMDVGYFDRAKRLGYGTALGTWGEKALNTLGGMAGGMALGPFGAILGGALGSGITGDSVADFGQQFGRNVVGGLINPALSPVLGPQLGSMASKSLANRAIDMALGNGTPGGNTASKKMPSENGGIGSLMAQAPRPLGQLQPSQAVAASGGYAPGQVTAMQWSPIQWGAQYDPLLRG